MIERENGASFCLESTHCDVGHGAEIYRLERQVETQKNLLDSIYNSHATASQHCQDAIPSAKYLIWLEFA
jgi:hypothetical protein